MVTIGITGKMGSGKSLVCSMLQELGATIFYSDIVAKEIMNTDKNVIFKIKYAFGSDCYNDDILDTKYLASKVFNNEKEMETLNSIVHPVVYERFNLEKEKNHKVLVMESALLFNTGFYRNLDLNVIVECEENVMIKRAMERDNCTKEEIEERTKYQTESDNKSKADYVINNNGNILDLYESVKTFYNEKILIHKENE